LPLSVAERTVGALNLYSRAANALTEADRARAAHFAAQAAGAVALALRLAEREERERHLAGGTAQDHGTCRYACST